MTYQEIFEMLESSNLPVTYYQWNEDDEIPPLPYLVFYFPTSDNFGADNKVYKNIQNMNVELYTKNKNFAIEKQIEELLEQNGFFWEKQESFIESENMYEVLYQMQVAINE